MKKSLSFRALGEFGFSLIEVMIVVGILAVIGLGAAQLFSQQVRQSNFLEFQNQKTQLRIALLGEFLVDPNNCKCLFPNAPNFPVTGTSSLVTTSPTTITSYTFPSPASCATAIARVPVLASADGVDGVKMVSVMLNHITATSPGNYVGNLDVSLQATKPVLGPSVLPPIEIQVAVQTTAVGTSRSFQGCSMTTGATASPFAPLRMVTMTFASHSTAGALGHGHIEPGTLACPPNTVVRSCGIFRPDAPADGVNEDQLVCTIDPGTNSCVSYRDQSHGADAATLQCFCQPTST